MNEREIFQGALEYSNPGQRQAYLDQTCGGDAALRARIEALLISHESASQFLNVPVLEQLNPRNEGQPFQTVDFPQTDGRKSAAADDGMLENEPHAAPDLSFLNPSSKAGSLGMLGHYEILNLLGQGAFGLVFRAFDEKLHRHVAIKVMNPQLAATSPPRKRFLREARSAAAIKHENIVQVYSVEEQPLPYLVMEYVEGQTLKDKLDNSGPLEASEILHLGRQMANGLAAAHAQGLIHRDIKPGNILIEATAEQKVKITDFGLARAADDATMTRTGVISGTPMYMAPEQAQGMALDHRTDLFSLGSVLYQMACGRPPFRGPTTIAVLKRVADEAPRPPQEILAAVPDWLCAIIAKLHAKTPEGRFQSAKEVADLLTRCQASYQRNDRVELPGDLAAYLPKPVDGTKQEPVFAEHSPGKQAALPPPSSRRRWVATAAAVLIAIFGGLSLTEATGVTNVRGTVIRLFSPDGTLVVEVDDPGVSVSIDGEEMVITGTGAKEIRLKPGQYKVLASKDGKVVSQELVTVSRNGRQVVRVSREAVNQSILQSIEKLDRRPQFRMGGEWRVEGNELVQTSPNNAAILFGDRNWTDYDFEVELNSQGKTKDGHGAGVLFRATDLANFFDFQIGGWSATVSEVTFLKKQQWGRVPGTFLKVPHEHDRWYKAKVEVRSAKIRCSVDGKDLFVFEDADHPKGMVGLSNGNSPVRWRNLKVTAPDGRVLWEGFPDLGPAAPSTDPDRKAAEWVLSIGGSVGVNDQATDIKAIVELPKASFRLVRVNFTGNQQVTDSGLAVLKDCTGLQHLFLGHTKVTNAGMIHLNKCKNLILLHLGATAVTDQGLVNFNGFTNVEDLHLGGMNVTDAGLANFKDCRKLKSVFLPSSTTDDGLAYFKDCINLELLNADNTKVSDRGLSYLKDCKNLSKLSLRQTSVTGSGLAHLHGLTKLNTLDLRGAKITNPGITHVSGIANLENLWLDDTALSDDGLIPLKELSKLSGLGLDGTKITDAGLIHLKSIKNLKSIGLRGTAITDSGLLHLEDCRGLAGLYLDHTKITNNGLDSLKELPNLEGLWLIGTAISDVGLAKLNTVRGLRDIRLLRTQVTAKGMAELHAALRNCKIWHDNGVIEPKMVVDPDRKAAEWVLANGGKVQIAPGGDVVSLDKLPTHKFTIGLISFDGLKFKEESELKCLAQLAHLEQVFFGQAPITGLGLGYFATCPEITVLALDSTAVRDGDLGVLKNLKKLQNLSLHNTRTTDAAIEHILECPRITQLDLSLTGITDAGLKKLEMLKGLQFIQVYQTKVSDEGVKKFAAALPGCKIRWDGGVIEPTVAADPDRKAAEYILSIPRDFQIAVQVNDVDPWIGKASDLPEGQFRLTGVGVEWASKLDDDGLANFAGCKHVKILRLVGTQATEKGLVHFKDCQDLQELSLVGDLITDSALEIFKGRKLNGLHVQSKKATDAGLAHFQGSNLLTSLALTHCPVTDRGMAYFKANKNLKTLSLAATQVTDAGLANFQGCKDLETLHLFWTSVSDTGLMHFKDCNQLKKLDLGRLALVTDTGLVYFKNCVNLEHLALGGTSIGDDGLAHLKNMKSLAFLGLQNTKVTDAGLPHLKECKLLGELHLWQTRVTGTGFVHLNELPNLSRLFLAECPVTDDSVGALSECVKLRTLGLTKTRLSEAGVKKLAAALPQCQIDSDHGKFGPGRK